jgi:adenosylmethionine-8-amino-7-oxononanoate aminotransferase
MSSTRYLGRSALGTDYPQTLQKNGQYHTVANSDGTVSSVLACGLACSECVSGSNLASVITPGIEYERAVLECLVQNIPAAPLSIHTSAGIPTALVTFIDEIAKHIPWRNDGSDDWCISLQMEGASSVLAAIDLLVQSRHIREGAAPMALDQWRVGVASTSYHGPPSSSPGSRNPLFRDRHNQIFYPVPSPFMTQQDHNNYISNFTRWLEDNHHCTACILVEPQWGSSASAYHWDTHTLQTVIELAHSKNVLVVADEIMCGLGRHGQGTVFLSEAWRLDVDAVTFGKAIAGGVYPLSGVILKRGAAMFGAAGRTVMQSHTYSGGNVRTLMAATEMLKLVPTLFPTISENGKRLQKVMRAFEEKSDGLFVVHGLGLMWGALANRNHEFFSTEIRVTQLMTVFKDQCKAHAILPYFVPTGGFMVTPLYDISHEVIDDIGEKLNASLAATMIIVGR